MCSYKEPKNVSAPFKALGGPKLSVFALDSSKLGEDVVVKLKNEPVRVILRCIILLKLEQAYFRHVQMQPLPKQGSKIPVISANRNDAASKSAKSIIASSSLQGSPKLAMAV
jgi:hypothetical protein